MQKKWLSILLFAPLMQSNYALADQATKKELDYKALGEVLFFDKSISFNKTQSCSTCHSPDTAFVDQRKNSANQMVSEGDNPHLHGNRNANTALYAMFSPDFHFDKKIQDYVGGQFWDGRAKDLAEQAGGPPVNPVEMGMPDKKSIVERLKANSIYYKAITAIYGESIWADTDKIYAIMEKAIGEFEKQALFAPFSSKYDRALKSEAELTALVDFSESEERLILEEKAAFEKMQHTAKQLHESRCQAAEKLAQQVTYSIKGLAMENAEFFIEVNSDLNKVAANGADNIVFTLRSNLGQQAQPLAKVASGGELSRISLAIQVLTSDQSAIPTLIFDEVDVGISGKTASVVGKLLRQLGDRCQVLCVTHLPQVACHGHHQFNVEKFTVDDKTETKMTALSQEERVSALARLLGGSEITDLALANAQEMLDLVK